MTADERMAYLALALTPGIGPKRLESLYATFGSWNGARSAPFAFLCTAPLMNRAAATAIKSMPLELVERVIHRMVELGGAILTPTEPQFPAELLRVNPPPTLLFTLGNLELAGREVVAIVGSRRPTAYGVEMARRIAAVAADAGLVVVSGMARGLDAVAHWATLDRRGHTIGVLGNGLGVVYPAANRELYQRVAAEGLLLTEYPPGERPNAGSFPRRNRLISGLARAVVVVEAATDSGALITTRTAAEQGRDVIAVPGQLTSRMSAGTNRLIHEGATPWLGPEDLLDRYPSISGPAKRRLMADEGPDPRTLRLERDQRRVYELLDGSPRDVDAIGRGLGLAAAEVQVALTELELAGLVDRTPTGFVRA